MSTHTPGPWEARYHLLLEEKRKLASLETLTEKQKLNLGHINNDLDCWYALREAAPAMLESLRGCERVTKAWLADMKDYPLINPEKAAATMELTRIQAAIRLAEGRGQL